MNKSSVITADISTLILEKLEYLEKEMSDLKSKYDSAPELLRTSEIAERLKVSEKTIYQWVNEGRIPFVKIGSTKYFKLSDIERFNRIEAKKPKILRR